MNYSMIWIKEEKFIPKRQETKIIKPRKWILPKTQRKWWWVELLFVQIGLPDRILIKILKTKKRANESIKNNKKSLIIFLLAFAGFVYLYPVIKHSKNKLDCEAIAKDYIINNKNIKGLNRRELKMLSTNFCYGGEEIYEIENSNT